MSAATIAYKAARDFLITHRTDYRAAYDGFRWPELTGFNWALDWFDGELARGELRDQPALIITGSDAVRLTFRELSQRSNRVANGLRALGVKRGDRILLMLGNIAPLWEVMLAAMKLGAVVVPAATLITGDDLAERVARARARFVIIAAEDAGKLAMLPPSVPRITVGAAPPGCIAYSTLLLALPDFTPDGPTAPDDPILLYAAKFQPRKRPDDLLRAAHLLEQQGVAFHLVLVGSGEMEAQLHALAAELGSGRVGLAGSATRKATCRFHGFVNQSMLPQVYAASDVFVLPSVDEPWGLAINEAMCAALPIVASAEIGCVSDLVRDEVNGRTFTGGDVEQLARVLAPMLRSGRLRQSMGAASRDIISRWSYAECRDGLRSALRSVADRRRGEGRADEHA